MRTITAILGALLPLGAIAGGFERSDQNPNILFNDGHYLEVKLSLADVDVDGTVALGASTQKSKDIAKSYTTLAIAYKSQLNAKVDWALSYSEPHGADVSYQGADAAYPYHGSWAKLQTHSLSAMLKYRTERGFSLYGGVRVEEFDADAHVAVTVPSPLGGAAIPAIRYQVSGEPDINSGHTLGIAFEKKDIALRVALSYNSEIVHNIDTQESASGYSAASGAYNIASTASSVETVSPKSYHLSAQSGISSNTLLFGSANWVNWRDSKITPPVYFQITGGQSLAEHKADTTTLKLGLAHKLRDTVTIAAIFCREKSTGKRSSNFSPTDGYDSLTLASSYAKGHNKITAALSFARLGNTYTNAVVGESDFEANKALGLSLSYGFVF